jgi:uncharacterized SAM-binding protein YcdF (DUF218 family)
VIQRLAALIVLVWAGAFAAFAILLPQPVAGRKTDGIVVLTGSSGRIERGVALLREGQAQRLFISGVDRDAGPVSIGRTYHISPATMRCCVELGHVAIDTRSNAIETADWIRRRHYKSVRLITADWHMRRAVYELRRQLPRTVVVLADAVPTQPSLRVLVQEYHKYLARLAAGLLGI